MYSSFTQLILKFSKTFFFLLLFASVIVEAMKVDSLQKLCSSLEPILRRVVCSVFNCIGWTLSTMLGFVFKKVMNYYSFVKAFGMSIAWSR